MNTTVSTLNGGAIQSVRWPAKVDLFGGVMMTPTTYDEAVRTLIRAGQARQGGAADFSAVHVLSSAARDPAFRQIINALDMVAPDGQPVRWAMNYFHDARLTDRVYGPELTIRLCAAAAEAGVSIYLYGSSEAVIAKLSANLLAQYPKLRIAGAESPPFRALTPGEDAAVIRRINDSGAGLVFIGIGCPKQEIFAAAHRGSIRAVQVCVGAAFDFHAGVKGTAPAWMQRRGMEWVYRLVKEPRRLWKRYIVTNSVYCLLFAKHAALGMLRRRSPAAPPRSAGAVAMAVDGDRVREAA